MAGGPEDRGLPAASAGRADLRLEELAGVDGWDAVIAGSRSLDVTLEARAALRLLAELPERQRADLALLVAGFSYREIAGMTGGRTFTNVSKRLARARARVRLAFPRAAEGADTDPRHS